MDESAKKDDPAGTKGVEAQQSATASTDLKAQAQVVREISRTGDSRSEAGGTSFLVRSCYTLLTFAVLFAVIILLSLSSVRRGVITNVHEQWTEWTASASSSEIFRLPPPPPRVVEKEVAVITPPVLVPAGDQATAVLYADGEEGEPSRRLGGKKPEVVLEKTKDSIAAYDLLTKKSRVVRELKEGKHPRYKFVDWRAVKNSAPVFWIDLLASDSSGKQFHLVWSVDLETKDLSALSQAARDLESEAGK